MPVEISIKADNVEDARALIGLMGGAPVTKLVEAIAAPLLIAPDAAQVKEAAPSSEKRSRKPREQKPSEHETPVSDDVQEQTKIAAIAADANASQEADEMKAVAADADAPKSDVPLTREMILEKLKDVKALSNWGAQNAVKILKMFGAKSTTDLAEVRYSEFNEVLDKALAGTFTPANADVELAK